MQFLVNYGRFYEHRRGAVNERAEHGRIVSQDRNPKRLIYNTRSRIMLNKRRASRAFRRTGSSIVVLLLAVLVLALPSDVAMPEDVATKTVSLVIDYADGVEKRFKDRVESPFPLFRVRTHGRYQSNLPLYHSNREIWK